MAEQHQEHYEVMADDGIFPLKIKTGVHENVTLAHFGEVRSLVIIPEFSFDGVLTDTGKYQVWVSDDPRHVITKAVIKGNVANMRVVLDGVKGPGSDDWSKPARFSKAGE